MTSKQAKSRYGPGQRIAGTLPRDHFADMVRANATINHLHRRPRLHLRRRHGRPWRSRGLRRDLRVRQGHVPALLFPSRGEHDGATMRFAAFRGEHGQGGVHGVEHCLFIGGAEDPGTAR